MILVVAVVLIIMNVVNVLLHGVGIYLLSCLHKRGKSNIQNLYILHLSISELLMNSLEIVRTALQILIKYGPCSNTCKQIEEYLSIFMFTGISVVFFFNMFFITLDRLLNIVYTIRYRVSWSEKRAKYLLKTTWLIGIFVLICVSIDYYLNNSLWENKFYTFIYPILEFIFIVLALVTYISIFRKYNRSERVLSKRRQSLRENKKPDNSFQVFRKSRFFVPVLLILTFIVFLVIPDMVLLFEGVIMKRMTDTLLTSCWISYAVSNMTDACIYIFMQDPVRRLLWKKIRQIWKRGYGESHNGLNTVDSQRSRLMSNLSIRSRIWSDESADSQQTFLENDGSVRLKPSNCYHKSKISRHTSDKVSAIQVMRPIYSSSNSISEKENIINDTPRCLRFASSIDINGVETRFSSLYASDDNINSGLNTLNSMQMEESVFIDPPFTSDRIFR